jgi:DNA-binding transcriptional LysR family regulator
VALDVSPQLLRALRAVIDAGSLTAASERLGFTQSALSKQIGALEAATGVTLFERGARGVTPTPAAIRLSQRAVVVLDQLDLAERELGDLAREVGGRVSLGGFPTTAMRLVPTVLSAVRASHPAIEVGFLESSTPVQIRRLRSGRLDLAIISAGDDLPDADLTGIETEKLATGPLRVAVHRGHRLANLARVPASELAGESWIVGRGARGEPQFGVWPTLSDQRVVAELGEWSTRLGFVAAGLGVTTIPTLAAAAVPADVVTIPVDDPRWRGRSMLLARIGEPTPAAEAVRAALHQAARRLADDAA